VAAMSWKRGNKGGSLDHIVTWNLPPESSAGVLGARWKKVGTEIPTGCTELDHPELAERLAYTVAFEKHEPQSLRLQDLTAQNVVRVGEHVYQLVTLGHVEWLGGPQHDHARVGFRIAPQVLAHNTRHVMIRCLLMSRLMSR